MEQHKRQRATNASRSRATHEAPMKAPKHTERVKLQYFMLAFGLNANRGFHVHRTGHLLASAVTAVQHH